MSTEIVTFSEMEKLAKAVAESGLFGMKKPAEALALMAIAQSQGMHPASAANEYHIIQGRPALKSDAILGRFQKAGGRVEWTSYTDLRVSGIFSHPAGGSVEVDWDIERAKKAGLGGKDMWNKYPRQMLRARVISEAVRTVYPSCLGSMYSVEEIEDLRPDPVAAKITLRTKLGLPESQEVETVPSQLDSVLQLVENAVSLEELEKTGQYAKSLTPDEQNYLRPLYKAKLDQFKEAALEGNGV